MPKEDEMTIDDLRNMMVKCAAEDIGQRETHGKNRSPFIDEIAKKCGVPLGSPWCAGWVSVRVVRRACIALGLVNPFGLTYSSQACYTKVPSKYRLRGDQKAKRGDLGIQQLYNDPTHGHVYMVAEDQVQPKTHKTIEGNTNGLGSRDGDGVYRQLRSTDGTATKKFRGFVDVAQWIVDMNPEKFTGKPGDEPKVDTSVPEKPTIPLPWDGQHKDSAKWTAYLLEQVEKSKLPGLPVTDGETFFSGYNELSRYGRVVFWMNVISKMAKFESSYKPECRYVENFKDNSGKKVVSRGLLQLSIESANSYPGVDLKDAAHLHDPYVNLHTTVRIMERLVSKHGRIAGKGTDGAWKGVAAYWSCMRSTKNGEQRDSYVAIVNHVRGLRLT